MKSWISQVHSDEEGPLAIEGKQIIISGSKEEINNLADFFQTVSTHLKENDLCHLQFRDFLKKWNKDNIDIEINVE